MKLVAPLAAWIVSGVLWFPHALTEDPKPLPTTSAESKAAVTYPTFDPFLEARMFKILVGDPKSLDIDKVLETLRKTAEIGAQAKKAGEDASGSPAPKDDGALLQPIVGDEIRPMYPIVPAIMIRLAPLWKSQEWSTEDLTIARKCAVFLKSLPDGPSLEFRESKPTENHAELSKLAAWFREQTAKPERYAAMIATMDDGPFAGMPYSATEVLPTKETVVLDEESKLELHVCKVASLPEPCVLQLVRDGHLVWSRILSGAPVGGVSEAKFRSKARAWKEYGWKVALTVKWTYGSESAYVYLGKNGELLFYFLTW